MAPFFSIIIACKNEEKYIVSTINSVINQEYEYFEVVVVDGGSTDRTTALIDSMMKSDKRVVSIKIEDHSVFEAMNNGIKASKGEYLLFLNVKDTLADKEVLQKIAEKITKNDCDILLGDFIFDRLDTQWTIQTEMNESFYKGLRYHWGICHQAVVAKRNTLCNGFNENYRFAADYDWFCEQLTVGKKITKTDIIITRYDGYGMSSHLFNRKKSDRECYEISCKWFDDAEDVWDELGYGTEKYTLKLKNDALRAQYNLLNDIFMLVQAEYDFEGWFLDMGYEMAAIYGMHHIGKRLYHIIKNAGIEITFVYDKKVLLGEYAEYNPLTDSIPEVDVIIVTPLLDYYEIKEKLQSKKSCSDYTIKSIEEIIADMKRDYYLRGDKCITY